MKRLLILLALLASCLVLWAGDQDELPAVLSTKEERVGFFGKQITEAWIGRPVDELTRIWGEPTKEKDQGRGGRLLVYKIQFPGRFQFTPNCHIAISEHGPYPIAGVYIAVPGKPVPEILGKLKARFSTDPDGIIVDAELLYLSWKKSRGAWAEYPAEEPPEPGEPFKTGVEVLPD